MEGLKGVRPLGDRSQTCPPNSLQKRSDPFIPDQVLDCYGLLCPVPVRKTAQELERMLPGQVLQVIATDDWFGPDLEAWLKFHPHELLAVEEVKQEIHAYLRKKQISTGL